MNKVILSFIPCLWDYKRNETLSFVAIHVPHMNFSTNRANFALIVCNNFSLVYFLFKLEILTKKLSLILKNLKFFGISTYKE